MNRTVWDDRALDDLSDIADYIAADSPRSAIRVVEYIRRAARALEASPELGFTCPEPGMREFILTRYPYILVCEIADDEVRILAVFHHRRKRR